MAAVLCAAVLRVAELRAAALCAVLLLAVAGDERNGVAFVQKGNDVFNIFLLAV